MTAQQYQQIERLLRDNAEAIVAAKRPDYTQDSSDVLQNFKDAARDTGITPLQVWLVHFQKQYSAVARWVKNPTSAPSEPLQNRFADLYNYLHLGFALFVESVATQTSTITPGPWKEEPKHDEPTTGSN